MIKPKSRLTSEMRHKAAIDMIDFYFFSYCSDWRYVKVVSIKKQLHEKYEFYKSIMEEIYGKDNEPMIAQEVRHGLFFDAIAECIQYIEDLFALINASEQTDFFIRNIITYQAGQIRNLIKTFNPSDEKLSKSFHFPGDLKFQEDADSTAYQNGIETLRKLVNELKQFYIDYEFFYMQYKHGLTLPMRPFGNVYAKEQIEKEKNGEFIPYVVAFDNFNLHAATIKKTFTTKQPVLMPGFTDNVRNNISELHNENNYLRFVFPPDEKINIEKFVEIAHRVRYCINLFITNYQSELHRNEKKGSFELPKDPLTNRVIKCSYASD